MHQPFAQVTRLKDRCKHQLPLPQLILPLQWQLYPSSLSSAESFLIAIDRARLLTSYFRESEIPWWISWRHSIWLHFWKEWSQHQPSIDRWVALNTRIEIARILYRWNETDSDFERSRISEFRMKVGTVNSLRSSRRNFALHRSHLAIHKCALALQAMIL